MRNVITSIQEDIEQGKLTFQQIARKHGVPLATVDLAHGELIQIYVDCDSWYDEQYDVNDY